MKTEWDYTHLAQAYLTRPDYSDDAIDEMVKLACMNEGDHVCDIGAGVAHLTLKLSDRSLIVKAIEPNDAMRALGIKRTEKRENVEWFEGTGENTGQKNHIFDLITFGSSFNVMDRNLALQEGKRLLKDNGWFAAMWNHRNLDDPIQSKIESIIKKSIPDYGYGTRREDQTKILEDSNLFLSIHHVEGNVTHTQTIEEVIEAWRSHATLHRQAGDKFEKIINDIENMLVNLGTSSIDIPYKTKMWLAQLK